MQYMDRQAAVDDCAAKYPLGSKWQTMTLGIVSIVGVNVARSPEDSYCGVTYIASPRIMDASGRVWSCYSPHVDLTPFREGK